jgi:hypothetical protein
MRWLERLRGLDLPPWGRGLPPISVQHSACRRCGALCGGISGKGPWKALRTESSARCRHAWQLLTLEAFRAEATARFGVDWRAESDWWQRPG